MSETEQDDTSVPSAAATEEEDESEIATEDMIFNEDDLPDRSTEPDAEYEIDSRVTFVIE
jgi:hypothetical protein